MKVCYHYQKDHTQPAFLNSLWLTDIMAQKKKNVCTHVFFQIHSLRNLDSSSSISRHAQMSVRASVHTYTHRGMYEHLGCNLHGLSDSNLFLQYSLTFPYILPSCCFFFFLFIEITLECFSFTKSVQVQDNHMKIPQERHCVNFHFKANEMQNKGMEIISWLINIQ